MRDINIIWYEYRIGNYITDEELVLILNHATKTFSNLFDLKDKKYQLVVDDLVNEIRKLDQYKAAREERD